MEDRVMRSMVQRVRSVTGLCLALAGWLLIGTADAADPEGVIHLFNGKNLDGFYTYLQRQGKDNDPDHVFTVTDGVLRITGQEFGYCATRKEYENYHLTAEFKWGEATHPPRKDMQRNSGLMFHVTGPDKIFPRSFEFQIIEGGTGDLIVVSGASLDRNGSWGNVSTPAVTTRLVDWVKLTPDGKRITAGQIRHSDQWRKRKNVVGFRAEDDLEKLHGEWNTIELIADGTTIQYLVNGKPVLRGTGVDPAKGKILLESEGAEIFFRKLDLRPLR
jgi:hypothetical protein